MSAGNKVTSSISPLALAMQPIHIREAFPAAQAAEIEASFLNSWSLEDKVKCERSAMSRKLVSKALHVRITAACEVGYFPLSLYILHILDSALPIPLIHLTEIRDCAPLS